MTISETGARDGGPPEDVRLARMLAACQGIGAGPNNQRILRALMASPGISAAALGKRLGMDQGQLWRELDALAAHHLVEREEIACAGPKAERPGFAYRLMREGWEEIASAIGAFVEAFDPRREKAAA